MHFTHMCMSLHACMHAQLLSHIQLFVTLRTVARQAPLSMGFSRREYWSGLPCPPPDLPNPGIEPASLTSPLPLAPLSKPMEFTYSTIKEQIVPLSKMYLLILIVS